MSVAEKPFVFDPYSPETDADPFPAYRRLLAHDPCHWSEPAGMWILTRYDDVVGALGDWRTYSSAGGNLMDELPDRAGHTLGTTDPPRHDRMRALISHAFARKNLSHLEGPIAEATQRAVAEIDLDRPFDFVEQVSSRVTTALLFQMLGLEGDEAKVREIAVKMVQSDPKTRSKGVDHLAAYGWMQDYAGEILAKRRVAPGDDLLSHLQQAEIEGERLSDREVLLTTTTLIMAGVESLSGFLAMFALNMCDFPEARGRVVADPDLLEDAVEESLRFNTSAQRFKRRLNRDVELHGRTMREGDFVCLCYGAANRDPRKFDNPDVYDLERRPKGHLGFGGGVHACLGSAIARLATRTAFAAFHERLPAYRRVDQRLDWMPSSTFRSPLRLMMERL